jgi:hypothetical protein
MDTQSVWEQIGPRAFLDELELLLGDEGAPRTEDHCAMLRALIEDLQHGCRGRGCFVEQLWRTMNQRAEALAIGRATTGADCLPTRPEMEFILRQSARAESMGTEPDDLAYLDAVEMLLRHTGRPLLSDLTSAYGESILTLWSGQMIRFRFLEYLWQGIQERYAADLDADRISQGRTLPSRSHLERMLEQSAFEWMEERRRSMEARAGGHPGRSGEQTPLSFS